MKHVPARLWTIIRRYPSVFLSLCIICFLLGISIYAMISIPLSEAIASWNDENPVGTWRYTPLLARPEWTNLFRREDLPSTMTIHMYDFENTKERIHETAWRETTLMTFDYALLTFPSEINLYYDLKYVAKRPLVVVTWIKPDSSEVELLRTAGSGGESRLQIEPIEVLGQSQPAESADERDVGVMTGKHSLRVEATTFEEQGFSIEGKVVLFGRVYGAGGTDRSRRNLMIGLLWGTPIALMFGFLAAIGTTVFAFVVAAIGAWFGGWVDATIQRVTEVSMMIPFLPTVLIVGRFYSSSIWVLLGVVIAFSLFSGPLKTYRAMFLQVKQSQYIEAARAYGAGNMRIIFRYLIPRMLPALLPRLILGVPLFVYLEASLAFLGIADPDLPTWGKILSVARHAVYTDCYYWALEPAFMLFLTGFSFSLLGYALDRVFNPRLRDV